MNLLAPDILVVRMAESVHGLGELTRKSSHLVHSQIGRWESEVEALHLILLAATHAVAIGNLARSSVSLLAPANALARATMEAGTRAMWLLAPDDPFTREGRWLAHLESEISVRKRLETSLKQEPLNGSTAVQTFAAAVRAKLPEGTVVPVQVPKFDALLRDIDASEKYVVYAFLSQTSHWTAADSVDAILS